MIFKGLQKTTLLDYPGKMAATVFTFGCNFRCPFCQNIGLVIDDGTPVTPEQQILEYLESRKKWLDGICITGGEPTIHKDLADFMKKVKDMGLLVKLDSNGSNPEVLEHLIENKLVDYIAMDVKQIPEKYETAIGVKFDVQRILKSIEIIRNSDIDYEFRTTVVPRIHPKEDILKIAEMLKGSKKYFLQQFRPARTLDPEFEKEKAYTAEELKEIGERIKGYFGEFAIRGIL